jgi:magnesium-transporting ATPase (P-type)
MSTVVKIDPKQSNNKRFRIFTKGASEIILKRCSKWIDPEGTKKLLLSVIFGYDLFNLLCSGNIHELDNEKAQEFNTFIDSMAKQGAFYHNLWIFTLLLYCIFLNFLILFFRYSALRTLCIAYRDFGPNELNFEAEAEPPETNLTLLAIIGIEVHIHLYFLFLFDFSLLLSLSLSLLLTTTAFEMSVGSSSSSRSSLSCRLSSCRNLRSHGHWRQYICTSTPLHHLIIMAMMFLFITQCFLYRYRNSQENCRRLRNFDSNGY